MSDGSQSQLRNHPRSLDREERELVRRLLDGVYPAPEIEERLAHAQVREMADGGMRSIRFVDNLKDDQRMGRVAAEAEYIDEDGIPVSISVNLDHRDNLFEIDFWKVNFSPLRKYPKPGDLQRKHVARASSNRSEAALASHT
jgi:hypothetical protein